MTAAFVGCVGDCRLFVGCCFSHQDPVRDRDKGGMSVCRLLFQRPFFSAPFCWFFCRNPENSRHRRQTPKPIAVKGICPADKRPTAADNSRQKPVELQPQPHELTHSLTTALVHPWTTAAVQRWRGAVAGIQDSMGLSHYGHHPINARSHRRWARPSTTRYRLA